MSAERGEGIAEHRPSVRQMIRSAADYLGGGASYGQIRDEAD